MSTQSVKSQPTVSVIGSGRATTIKDQVEIIITVSATDEHSKTSSVLPSDYSSIAAIQQVTYILSQIQKHLTETVGKDTNVELVFTNPNGAPSLAPLMVTATSGGFFSSGPSKTVVGGYRCAWSLHLSATLSAAGRAAAGAAANFAAFTAKLLDAVEVLPSVKGILPALNANATAKPAAIESTTVHYITSPFSRNDAVEKAREKAFEDIKARSESVAKAFGIASSQLRVVEVDESVSVPSDGGRGSPRIFMSKKMKNNNNINNNNNAGIYDQAAVVVVTLNATYAIDGVRPVASADAADKSTTVSFEISGTAPVNRNVTKFTATIHAGSTPDHPVSAAGALQELLKKQVKIAQVIAASNLPGAIVTFDGFPRFSSNGEKKSSYYAQSNLTVTLDNSATAANPIATSHAVARCFETLQIIDVDDMLQVGLTAAVAGPDAIADNDNLNDTVSETAARTKAIAEAQARAADYAKRLNLTVVGVESFEESGDAAAVQGACDYSRFGGYQQQQQQQNTSMKSFSASSSYNHDYSANAYAPVTEFRWNGSVSFKFAPKQ